MCKYILIGLIVLLIVLMVVAAVVVQEYGWNGFFILVGVMVLLAVVARFAIPRLIRYLVSLPLRQMGAALHGARIEVYSVTPCDPPPPDEYDYLEAIDNDVPDADDYDPAAAILNWYRIEFSVVPADAGPSAGRVVHRRAWSPEMIGAVGAGTPSPEQFDDTQVQHTPAELIDGESLMSNPYQVFGEARLQMRVGVAPRVTAITITYAHFTEIGVVPIPRIDIRPDAVT